MITRLNRMFRFVRSSGIDSIVLLAAGVTAAILDIAGISSTRLTLSIATALLAAVAAAMLRAESTNRADQGAIKSLNSKLDELAGLLGANVDPGLYATMLSGTSSP